MLREFLSRHDEMEPLRQLLALVAAWTSLIPEDDADEDGLAAVIYLERSLQLMMDLDAQVVVDGQRLTLTPTEMRVLIDILQGFTAAWLNAVDRYPWWSPLQALMQVLQWRVQGVPFPDGVLEAELPTVPSIVLRRQIFWNAARTRLVEADDPQAAFLAFVPDVPLLVTALSDTQLSCRLGLERAKAIMQHRDAMAIVHAVEQGNAHDAHF